MNITLVHPTMFLGGAEIVVARLAEDLQKMGHKVNLAVTEIESESPLGNYASLKCVVSENRLVKSVSQKLRKKLGPNILSETMYEIPTLRNMIASTLNRCDVINPHGYPSYWASAFFSDKRPIVWNCNEVYPEFLRLFRDSSCAGLLRGSKYLFRASLIKPVDTYIVKRYIDIIVVLSELNRQRVKKQYGRDSLIVRSPVDDLFFEKCEPSAVISKYKLENSFVVLQVGWLQSEKRPLATLLAAKLLVKRIPNLKVVFAGEGPQRAYLMMKANELDINENVVFTGLASQRDIHKLYHACDVNVFPVLEHSWGLTPFEALASGRVSVVSSRTGAAELIGPNDIGVVVYPTPNNLAEAIFDIYKHPRKCEEKVTRGREFVEKHLKREIYAQKMIEVYEKALMKNKCL